MLFAVAGLKEPRVIVSAGALASLDDDELAAALDHERGHIARHHRFVMLAAVTLSALGRVLPGTSHAVREIVFHLERDADRWALRPTAAVAGAGGDARRAPRPALRPLNPMP